jgi:hypothetical protein
MDAINLYVSADLVSDFLRLAVTYGIGGAFGITTVLILLTMVVYKALSLVGNTN